LDGWRGDTGVDVGRVNHTGRDVAVISVAPNLQMQKFVTTCRK
jgi:hypothetical protein